MINSERTDNTLYSGEDREAFREVRSNPKRKRIKNRKLLDEIKELPCVICSRGPCDPSHITSRGAGGDDTYENVAPMCRLHHRMWHDDGRITFTKKFPEMRAWLKSFGREDILGLLERD